MIFTGATNINELNRAIILKQYERVLAIKNGSIFDIIDLSLNRSEFTFFYRLLHFFEQGNDQRDQELLNEAALLSTLVYLSSKIHFSISEHTETEADMRGKLQFPILVGDLLYSCFFEEIVKGNFMSNLEDYATYLNQFHADMIDYLSSKTAEKDFLANQLADLAKLTLSIWKPDASADDLHLAQQLGRAEGGLLAHTDLSAISLSHSAKSHIIQERLQNLLQQLKEDSDQQIISFQQLIDYFTI